MVEAGDILYALYGATSGEVSISRINGAINQAILCIRPYDMSKQYLRYLLEDSKDDIINTYLQGGQGNLSGSIVKNLILNVPNADEQQKIGAFFKYLIMKCIVNKTDFKIKVYIKDIFCFTRRASRAAACVYKLFL